MSTMTPTSAISSTRGCRSFPVSRTPTPLSPSRPSAPARAWAYRAPSRGFDTLRTSASPPDWAHELHPLVVIFTQLKLIEAAGLGPLPYRVSSDSVSDILKPDPGATMKKLLVGTVAAFALGTIATFFHPAVSAYAADLPTKAPNVLPIYNSWT